MNNITIFETKPTSVRECSEYLYEMGPGFRVLFTILIIQSIVTTIGNALTIIVVFKDAHLRTMANMHIASLASADFIGGLTALFEAIWFIDEDVDTFLNRCKVCCILWYVLFFISFVSSLLSMTLIALDRWLYIAYPMRYYIWITLKKTTLMIGLSWTVAIFFGIVPAFINRFDNVKVCMNSVITEGYVIYGVGTILFGTCIFTFTFYFKIFLVARKQNCSVHVQNGSQGHTIKTYRQIRLLFWICCITFSCWIPFYVEHLPGAPSVSFEISNFIVCIALVNSCANFFLYSAKNAAFRKSALKLFPCFNNNLNRT